MFRFVVLSCAVFALAHGSTTQVSQCIFFSGELPINTYIEGCTTPPCALPQQQDAVINIEFETPGPVESMRTLVEAFWFFIIVPYDLAENSLTCNFLTNASCPVADKQVLNYTLRMPLQDYFPVDTRVNVEFRVVDESNNPLVCLRVPMFIAPPVA